ncbi:MAG: site-specific DNA-methyltransferase [Candidatus Delongbacteria bacterium]|nr:site-specific DNA-methyltransferase [Candidatus Delongbacteria bacterium]
MDKLNMKTKDLTQENINKLTSLFPELLTEVEKDGKKIKTINVEKLRKIVGDYSDVENEVYELTWAGKNMSRHKIVMPISKTLRPVPEESVDFENTQNLFIEGDNFEVLKILQESYLNKIKMIYIDPPYNTGNDFIYKDDFSKSKEEYDEEVGAVDEDGNKLFRNTATNGRFHSDWLSMMYERLVIARDLLRDDGVIFISIDDNEVANLRKLCDDIFGELNHVGIISRLMKSGGNKGQFFSPNIEYILVYAKSISDCEYFREPISKETADKSYNNIETEGENKGERYSIKGLCQPGLDIRPNQRYWIKCPDGSYVIPKGVSFPSKISEGEKITPKDEDSVWKWTFERYKKEKENNNIIFKPSNTATALVDEKGNIAKWNVFNKIWLKDRLEAGRVPVNFISKWENRHSSSELKKLKIPFDFAKPSELIKYLIILVGKSEDDIILDFFSGSSTTAHAVMQLNAEDGGKRKFIMVQLPEETGEDSDAYKKGFKTIADIGKERIRKVAKNIQQEVKEKSKQKKLNEEPIDFSNLDLGFRVFKVDSTNMKDVYYNPSAIDQRTLGNFKSNIKDDRTDKDLLYQVLLELAIPISAKVNEEKINNKAVYKVNGNFMVACFDDKVDLETVKKIAEMEPLRIVFKDSSFKDDAAKVNCDEYLKNKLPNTIVKVI